jgi:V/A-type H+-transporting ATPase subunit D
MAMLNIAPTKSALLSTRQQLGVAEEGYDLLEQKRQILVFELMSRLKRAGEIERRMDQALALAFKTLQEATLDGGSIALDQATLGVPQGRQVHLTSTHLMGLRLPRVTAHHELPGLPFGVSGTSSHVDLAMKSFVEILPVLAEMAELQNGILRLSAELRKTQRRCNALIKIFIPDYRQTISYIAASLEEREREAFIIVRMIRDRLAAG